MKRSMLMKTVAALAIGAAFPAGAIAAQRDRRGPIVSTARSTARSIQNAHNCGTIS
jgi:hypothetical protein